MTNQQAPEALAFCWATELAMTQQPVTLSVTEAREVSAWMQRLHAENTTLQAGYDAARLEIESLQARIKTMTEEQADELMVAHMDGRMRAAQPAGAQQPGTAYAELPSYEHQRAIMEAERNASLDEYSRIVPLTSTESMIYERAFTNGWNRRASHGQAPAQPAPQQETQEPVMWAMWRESTGWLATSCEKTRDECIATCIEAAVSEGLPPDFAATRGWIPRPLYASLALQWGVLEDAARYRWLRDVGDQTWVPFRIRTGYSAAQVDDAIDVARKQGANHD